jgi:ketosteroid isomerase-like protein
MRAGKPYRGFDGIFAYFHDVGRVWDELEVVPQQYRDAGDHVLVFGRLRARRLGGCHGGLLIDVPAQWLFRVRDGKVAWAYAYANREEALGALGLEE